MACRPGFTHRLSPTGLFDLAHSVLGLPDQPLLAFEFVALPSHHTHLTGSISGGQRCCFPQFKSKHLALNMEKVALKATHTYIISTPQTFCGRRHPAGDMLGSSHGAAGSAELQEAWQVCGITQQ